MASAKTFHSGDRVEVCLGAIGVWVSARYLGAIRKRMHAVEIDGFIAEPHIRRREVNSWNIRKGNSMTAEIRKFIELTDAEIDAASVDNLRAAYKALRQHHIDETTILYERLKQTRAQR